MKSEAEMQTEGKKIMRWRNQTKPIHKTRSEAEAQTKLNEAINQ